MIEAGLDVKVLAEILRHSDGGTIALETYSHVRSKHKQEQVRKAGLLIKAAGADSREITRENLKVTSFNLDALAQAIQTGEIEIPDELRAKLFSAPLQKAA